MKTQLNKGQLLLTLGCLFGLTNATGAAESVKEMAVVVAATSASLSAAPAAVTVINARNIETKNAPRPGDMLDQAPSLYLRGDMLGHDGSI